MYNKFLFYLKQECIPVGCVPSAVAAISGGGCASGELVLPGGCASWEVCFWGGGIPACTEVDPPVNRMTDRCKNNLRNFVADGKYCLFMKTLNQVPVMTTILHI